MITAYLLGFVFRCPTNCVTAVESLAHKDFGRSAIYSLLIAGNGH